MEGLCEIIFYQCFYSICCCSICFVAASDASEASNRTTSPLTSLPGYVNGAAR